MYPRADDPACGVFVEQQAESLRQLGHQVDILHVLGHRSKLNYLKAALAVSIRTLRESYDVVHAHYGLSGLPALFRFGAPLVVTLHGSDVLGPGYVRFISRIVCRLADQTIPVSDEMAAIISGEVIPCGVDLEKFRPLDQRECRTRLSLPTDAKLILFPFNERRGVKRYDVATRAVDALMSQGCPCRLMHVCRVKNEEMPLYYNAVDVMLLCSDHEGSPVSVKEALACNTPVVSTDVGDVREIMKGVAHTRVCEQNVGQLANALKEILLANTHEAFNGHLAMERYGLRRTAGRILDVYKGALNGHSR